MAQTVINEPNLAFRGEGNSNGSKSANDLIAYIIYYMRSSVEGNTGIFAEILAALGGGGPPLATEETLLLVSAKLPRFPLRIDEEELTPSSNFTFSVEEAVNVYIRVSELVGTVNLRCGLHQEILHPVLAENVSTGVMSSVISANGIYRISRPSRYLNLNTGAGSTCFYEINANFK